MNNSIEFEIAADVLAAVADFSKNMTAHPLNQIDSEFFVSAVKDLVHSVYGYRNAVLYYRLENGGTLFCTCPEPESPCIRDSFEPYIASAGKIETEYHNPGKIIKPEYHAYICISFFIKKEFFFSIVVCGKKSEVKQAEQTAPFLQSYIASEFRRIRKTKKEFKAVKKIEQEMLLQQTNRLLRSRRSNPRWFADDCRSAFAAGTDFSNIYPCRKDIWISCLCDVTVPPDSRHTLLLLIDTYLSVLSRSGCDAETAVRQIGQVIHDKSMEMYASIICTQYDKTTGTVTVCGTGSCRAFFIHHDTNQCTEFVFGEPFGCRGIAPGKIPLEVRTLKVLPGDVLFLCTDGILSAQTKNGGNITSDIAASLVKKYSVLSAAYLMEKFRKSLTDMCTFYNDDLTCQVFKYE